MRIIHKVKCKYCEATFDADSTDCVKIGARYAHSSCAKETSNIQKDELYNYIKKLFQEKAVYYKINKQVQAYINDYHFTYSGIRHALTYFYEIKGNDIEEANGGIGIVPYCYADAYNYYYSLWLARQKNEEKDIKTYIPKEREVHITAPARKVRKRKLFSFLDEEVNL